MRGHVRGGVRVGIRCGERGPRGVRGVCGGRAELNTMLKINYDYFSFL